MPAKFEPIPLDFLTRIINVQWEEIGQHFLYSGADGMFGSEDGQTWKAAPSSVPAVSLAWIDDVWIASGPSGCWRSEDGAETWISSAAPAFLGVAAMKSDDTDATGVFAGWLEDEDGENQTVYTSHDLGITWHIALTIPTTVGDGGTESIIGLSGCGGALFVCTNRRESPYHHGDGMIYSSADGHDFSSAIAFGPGNTTLPEATDQYPRIGFAACAVGYDTRTKTYIAIGDKEIIPSVGVQESFLVYKTSTSLAFGAGDGTVAASAIQSITGGGDFISVTSSASAAGGAGTHVTGLFYFRYSETQSFISGELQACFIPGAPANVRSMGDSASGYIGSFCFKPADEEATDGSGGIFACVAFGSDMAGGVYIAGEGSTAAAGGEFALTHSGAGIDIGGAPAGAVAVGKLEFLGETV